MTINAVLYGFDLASLTQLAQAQEIGSQRSFYTAQVALRLGDSPVLEIQAANVPVYRTSIVGSLAATSAGILMPTQFTEPPVLNTANTLADAQLIIRNKDNTNVYIKIPLKSPGDGDHLAASQALNGTAFVRSNNLLLAAPAGLDTGSNVTNEMILADLYRWMEGPSSQPTFGKHNSDNAVNQMPVNHQAVISAANFQGTSRSTFDSYWNACTTWFWFYYGQGNQRYDKRVQIRNLKIAVLRASTNQWVYVPNINKPSMCQMWKGNTSTYSLEKNYHTENLRDERDGVSVILTDPIMGAEVWPANFYAWVDRELAVDAKCMIAYCQVRVINDDGTAYAGTDAKYTCKLGYTLYFNGQDAAPGTSSDTVDYGKHATAGSNADGAWLQNYPRFLWDGGNGQWRVIDGSMGWVNVGVIGGYTGTFATADGIGAPFPWGNWTTPAWPYNKEPYCLTKTQLEANLPVFVIKQDIPAPGGDTGTPEGKMTSAMIDRIMNTTTGNGNNDSRIYPFPAPETIGQSGGTSWRYGTDWGFGGLFKKNPAPHNIYMNPVGTNGFNADQWNNFQETWMVFMHSWDGYGGHGDIDIRNVGFQYLETSSNTWKMAWKNDNTIGWHPKWTMQSDGNQGYSPAGGDAQMPFNRAGAGYDTLRIEAGGPQSGHGNACHFSFSSAFTQVPASGFKMYVCCAQVRRGSGSHANHLGLVHLGNDPKFERNAGDSRRWWDGGSFPNSNVSRSIHLTTEWQDLFIAPIVQSGHIPSHRGITEAELRANPPLYPF